MFVAKKAVPRRAVLRGIGATLALPFLDSMVPALSALAKTAANPVNRFGVMYVPNGMIMQNYLPALEGAGYELTPTLTARARSLTSVCPPDSETWLDAGISMDQILAQHTGKQTQLASLELAIETG